jgi:hypothetical protein
VFKSVYCKIVGHKLKRAGACPFTGKTYDVCDRCLNMIEINLV